MQTDVILISSNGTAMENALAQADLVADYKHLSHQEALHLRLLTEEMVGMMRSITGETKGKFWIEDESGEFRLHLAVETKMTGEKREQLLAASTSGKNESAKGLMGRIRDFIDRGADKEAARTSGISLPIGFLPRSEGAAQSMNTTEYWEWSMRKYEEAIQHQLQADTAHSGAKEAWDELEKSVVAHVADDVKVSIRGKQTEVTIIKKFN